MEKMHITRSHLPSLGCLKLGLKGEEPCPKPDKGNELLPNGLGEDEPCANGLGSEGLVPNEKPGAGRLRDKLGTAASADTAGPEGALRPKEKPPTFFAPLDPKSSLPATSISH